MAHLTAPSAAVGQVEAVALLHGIYRHQQPPAARGPVSGDYVDVQAVQAAGAVVARRASGGRHLGTTVGAREGLVARHGVGPSPRFLLGPTGAAEQLLRGPVHGVVVEEHPSAPCLRYHGIPQGGVGVELGRQALGIAATASRIEERTSTVRQTHRGATRSMVMPSMIVPRGMRRTACSPPDTEPNLV